MTRQKSKLSKMLKVTILSFIAFAISTARGVEISGTQAGIWTLSQSPYIVTGNILVPGGMTMEIEPGVVVKFAGYYGIRVAGTLKAVGRNDARIVFTSANDNEFNTAAEISRILPTNQDWAGIEFSPASRNTSKLDYCIIRYSDKAISANNAEPMLAHTVFVDCNTANINVNGQVIAVQNGVEFDYNISEESSLTQRTVTVERELLTNPSLSDVSDVLGGEEYSFGEITVVSAAKYAQRISEAPAAISVLTGNEIQWVGQSNIADMLRLVPGIDVSVATAGNINVNPRGYNRLYSNRTLVLVDGRTVYLDFFGVIFWPTIPVQLEEIDRLEVIRGPGGSLYGANAYSGVINLMTKRPESINGTHIVSRIGSQLDAYRGSVVHGGRSGKTGYRFSLGWQTASEYGDRKSDALKNGTGDLLLEHNFSDNARISLDAGQSNGKQQQLLPWVIFAMPVESDIKVSHGKVDLELADWKFSTYVNNIAFDALGTTSPFVVLIDNNLYNFSMENLIKLGSRSNFVWGATYRWQTFEGSVAEKHEEIGLFSGFGQIGLRPSNGLSFTLGFRADQNPAGVVNVPLKASLMMFPGANHAIRMSYGRSYRSASLVETFVVSQFGPASVLGNKDLSSESMESYELGYRASMLRGRLNFELNLFQETLKDFIIFAPTQQGFSFENFGKSKNTGGELELNFLIGDGFRGRAYYAYQKVEDEKPKVGEEAKTLFFEKAAPQNKFGLFLGTQRRKFTGFIGAQYIDQFSVRIAPQEVMQMIGSITDMNVLMQMLQNYVVPEQHVDAHVLVNARIAYKVSDNVEISIEGYNVIDDRFREYPLAEELSNRVTCTVSTFF